jgi:hypothetical protein
MSAERYDDIYRASLLSDIERPLAALDTVYGRFLGDLPCAAVSIPSADVSD